MAKNITRGKTVRGTYYPRINLNSVVYKTLMEADNNGNCFGFANWNDGPDKYVRIHVNNLNKDITFRPSKTGVWMSFMGKEQECFYDYEIRKHLLNIFNIAGK